MSPSSSVCIFRRVDVLSCTKALFLSQILLTHSVKIIVLGLSLELCITVHLFFSVPNYFVHCVIRDNLILGRLYKVIVGLPINFVMTYPPTVILGVRGMIVNLDYWFVLFYKDDSRCSISNLVGFNGSSS